MSKIWLNRFNKLRKKTLSKVMSMPRDEYGLPGFKLQEETFMEDGILRRKTRLINGNQLINEQVTEMNIGINSEGRLMASVPAPASLANKSVGETIEVVLEEGDEDPMLDSIKEQIVSGKDVPPEELDEIVVRLKQNNLVRNGQLQLGGANAVNITKKDAGDETLHQSLSAYNDALGFGNEYRKSREEIWLNEREERTRAVEQAQQEMARGNQGPTKDDVAKTAAMLYQRQENINNEEQDILNRAAQMISSQRKK